MANDPSDPRSPNDPKTAKPADTPAPKAVPPGDWLYSDPDAPLPPAEPPLEVIPLGSPTSPEPPHIPRNPRVDPADALADLPPMNPAYPASGWLDADVGVEPAAPGSDDGTSDVGSTYAGPRSGSDVIRGLSSDEFELPSGHSSVFDLDSSGRFNSPDDATDDDSSSVKPASVDLPPAEQSSGELFPDTFDSSDLMQGSDVNVGNPASGLIIGPGSDYPPMGRGSSLFDDPAMPLGSGVNLSDPEWNPEETTGPGSSIFDSQPDDDPTPRIPIPGDRAGPGSGDSELVLDDPEAAPPELASNIFQRGSGPAPDPGQISFDLPGGKYGKPESHDSGRIDWTLPQDDTDLSNLLSSDAARDKDIPSDLASLQEEDPDDSLFGAAARKTTRRPKSRPPVDDTAGIVIGQPGSIEKTRAATTRAATAGSWHDRPSTIMEPAPRRGALGWVAGGALGLLFGVAACAAVYFGGVVPNAEDQSNKLSALTASLDLVKKDSESQVNAAKKNETDAKKRADRAESDRKGLTTDLSRQTTKLASAENERKKLAAEVTAEKKRAADAQAAVAAVNAKFEGESRKLMDEFAKKVADATKAADEQAKLATAAAARAEEAAKKLKDADTALTALVAALKAGKLVDEKDDVAAAVAKAPDAIRRAGATATSSDAVKAAEALLAARKELDAARADAAAMKSKAAAAETAAANARTEAEKTVVAAKAETDTKVREAVAALTVKNEALAADLRRAEDDFRQKLAAKDEEFTRQLADARSGRAVAMTSGEVRARERAADLFADGVAAFMSGRLAAAEATLDEATRLDGSDARLWYFLGLAQHAQGKAADAAFKKGGDLEARGMPNSRVVGLALEGIYGPGRRALSSYRP